MNIQENINLAQFTTIGVGGPARYFVEAVSRDELQAAIDFADEKSLEIFVLGSGSNIVISDDGFDGIVIRPLFKGISHEIKDKEVAVRAGAGEEWDDLVQYCVSQGWWGIENLSGVPGTVGAVPVQNINAYGQQVSEVLQSVEAFDLELKEYVELKNEDCGFKYRTSLFNTTAKGRYIITNITVTLDLEGTVNSRYEYIRRIYNDPEYNPAISEVREVILEQRRKRGMLKGMHKNAGSFFRNSTNVSDDTFHSVYTKILEGRDSVPGNCCPDPWFWRVSEDSAGNPDGNIKIAAAGLVHFFFPPGTRDGNVGNSPDHALSINNYGGATAKEVLDFARKIQTKVKDEFDIYLGFEPELIGFADNDNKISSS